MRLISLQSGSNGNCVYVETTGVRLLIDAGISGKQAEVRLQSHGRYIRDVDAVLISHDHNDHTRCAGIYQRKFGLGLYITEPTLAAAGARKDLGKLSNVEHFVAGSVLRFGDVRVETIPTPHDGVDGVCFVIDDGRRRVGVLTDLGHVFDGLGHVLSTLDAVLIESNYDPAMLQVGPYPAFLKRRISGNGGHLSNAEATELLARHGTRLQWACLGHLSGDNNTPTLARRTAEGILRGRLPLHVASRHGPSGVLEV